MISINHSPIYNLSAVLKETGLKADVLRAWERRYALPKPRRSNGGHRIYSEYDIKTIKWLKERQHDGLSISRAVELWKEIIDAGGNPFTAYPLVTTPVTDKLPIALNQIETLRKNWLEACYRFDGTKAEEILNQSFSLYPVETVCIEILQYGLNTIGEDWFSGAASVHQEHFASALAIRHIEALINSAPPPTRQQSVLMGCPAGERHTFPALLLNYFLLRNGLQVIYLGADIPLIQIEEAVKTIQPDLIILVAQQLTTAAVLQNTAMMLQENQKTVAYGGHIFNRIPNLIERIPAYFLGETIYHARNVIEPLVVAPAPFPKKIPRNERLEEIYRLFLTKRSGIEHTLFEKLLHQGLEPDVIVDLNTYFGNLLLAALQLGDPAFLEAETEWKFMQFANRKIPAINLISYLETFRNLIYDELGNFDIPLNKWITTDYS